MRHYIGSALIIIGWGFCFLFFGALSISTQKSGSTIQHLAIAIIVILISFIVIKIGRKIKDGSKINKAIAKALAAHEERRKSVVLEAGHALHHKLGLDMAVAVNMAHAIKDRADDLIINNDNISIIDWEVAYQKLLLGEIQSALYEVNKIEALDR